MKFTSLLTKKAEKLFFVMYLLMYLWIMRTTWAKFYLRNIFAKLAKFAIQSANSVSFKGNRFFNLYSTALLNHHWVIDHSLSLSYLYQKEIQKNGDNIICCSFFSFSEPSSLINKLIHGTSGYSSSLTQNPCPLFSLEDQNKLQLQLSPSFHRNKSAKKVTSRCTASILPYN